MRVKPLRRVALFLATAAAMTAGGCAGGEVEELPPIEPYLGYFMSVRSGTIYLFEAFEDKQAYDANRLDEGAPFRAFVDRAGDRVMILAAEPIDLEARQQERTAEEEALAQTAGIGPTGGEEITPLPRDAMVLRIARGWEQQENTRLFRAGSDFAPPVDLPPGGAATGSPDTRPTAPM